MVGFVPALAVAAPAGAPTPSAAAPTSPPPPAADSLRFGLVPRPADGSARVHGFSFGLLGDRAAAIRGVQLSLFYADAAQELHGVQLAGGFNFVDAGFRGVQLAGAANFATDGRGTQAAVGFNVAGRFRGVQLALGNQTDDGKGLQIGVVNRAARFDGAQVGLTNGAEEMRGVQVGLVNAAGSTSGAQLGLVNVAREASGFQLGVVNLAAHQDAESLALLNLIGDGIHELALYATDTMISNLAVKLGGRHLYTALVAAYHPGDDLAAGPTRFSRRSRRFGVGLGVGWRRPLDRGRLEAIELEAIGTALRSHLTDGWRDPPFVGSLRAGIAVRLSSSFALLAGLSANVAVGTGGDDADVGLGLAEISATTGQATIRIYPGLFVGVQI
jgi:hypothetical protein